MCLWLTLLTFNAVAADGDQLATQVVEFYQAGRYAEAEVVARKSLDARRRELGDRHPNVATNLNNLAMILYARAKYAEVSDLYKEALSIQQEALGPRDPKVATTLNNLGGLLQTLGDNDAARPLFEEALHIRMDALGHTDPLVAQSQNNLAMLLSAEGDLASARTLYEHSLTIQQQVLGPDHPDTAETLGNLGALLARLGEYDDARPLLEQRLSIQLKALGPEHPEVAQTLNNLATLLVTMGDYQAARPLYEASLSIQRATLGSQHPDVAQSLTRLAKLLQDQGYYAVAKPLYVEIISIWRALFGPQNINLAVSMEDLAGLLKIQQDYPAARELYQGSLSIKTAALGPDHIDVARGMGLLGAVLLDLGQGEAALPLLEKSLAIHRAVLGPGHAHVASSLSDMGRLLQATGNHDAARVLFKEALEISRSALGPDHPDIATALALAATLEEEEGNPDQARQLRDEALKLIEGRLSLLDALSEREALAFIPSLQPALHSWLAVFDRPEDASVGWRHTLHFKGAIGARARANHAIAASEPAVAAIAVELARARRQIASGAPPEELASLHANKERLERELSQRSVSYREAKLTATPADICAALPSDAVLVDLLQYMRGEEAHYLAFVQRSADCEVHRVELGPAAPLDDAAANWREAVIGKEAGVNQRGQLLSSLLWKPLAAVAGDAAHWLVIPDGALTTVPLGALLDEGGSYILENHLVTYLERAGDVLRAPQSPGRGALIVGDVDYPSDAPCDGALPPSAAEIEAVSAHWRRNQRKEPLIVLRGGDATKSVVGEALRGRSLVHIATHGRFATGDCRAAMDPVGFDPMMYSGLWLADGLLTASELASYSLAGTQVVVLSASESGLGEIVPGQGVLGLRHAVDIAGAGTIITSLWSISETETAALMNAMYKHYLKRKGMPIALALREAQLQMLDNQRSVGTEHPHDWAAFIATGDSWDGP